MVVGARITVPGHRRWASSARAFTPYLREIGWLGAERSVPQDRLPHRAGTICGAAVVDLSLLAVQARRRGCATARPRSRPARCRRWKQVNMPRLLAWVVVLGRGASSWWPRSVLEQPLGFIALRRWRWSLLFVLVNGISLRHHRPEPDLVSAFVVSVLLMSLLGLKNPLVGLMAATILLISTCVGCDMQQDRSTGWRLGTDRVIQFRYQVLGILMGAVLCVVLARVFMAAYPVLAINQLDNPKAEAGQWGSAMTYKFVGAIRSLGALSDAHGEGAAASAWRIGFVIEVARKLLKRNERYQRFVKGSRAGYAVGWTMDAVLLSSPYASSFGGFVNLPAALWFGVGGILSSLWNTLAQRAGAARRRARPVRARPCPRT